MMTSLPLVSDLAHPSMRERHWKLLMRATGKNFTMDDSFSLGDLLALGLHDFVEEVDGGLQRYKSAQGLHTPNDKFTDRTCLMPGGRHCRQGAEGAHDREAGDLTAATSPHGESLLQL